MSILNNDVICGLLLAAWRDSQPGTNDAHEEGGFVLQDASGTLSIERWPIGVQNAITVPIHSQGQRGSRRVVATFHTHPNTGSDYQQEPSLTDIRAVRDDPDLSHQEYEGEYVIASDLIYRIAKNGDVNTVGETKTFLKFT